MGLSASALNRFRDRVDETLAELFPCSLRILGTTVAASGPGAKTTSEYIDSGESEQFRFPFRFLKTDVPNGWKPEKGASVEWLLDEGTWIPLEIIEAGVRPHETRHSIVCRIRRV
jgi:hypothetical protein